MKRKKYALIGLDGSGKSTNIEKMKNDEDYHDYSFIWVRWKPLILRPLYYILNKRIQRHSTYESDSLNEEYKKKKGIKDKIFKNKIIKKMWLYMCLFDYLIQFYFKYFKVFFKRKNIIFDRFYLDLFVDQCINLNCTNDTIKKIINKYKWLFPKIDKYVYIKVSPEICLSRKNDIPNIDYLNKRYEIYEYLSEDEWFIVEGTMKLDDVYSEIKHIMLGEKK